SVIARWYSFSVCFYRLLLPPRILTLFPYTTLFRSTGISPAGGPTTGGTIVTISGTNFTPGTPTVSFGGGAGSVTAFTATSITVTDRKSTRLNSSHGSNSYAVFCLKKKTD